MTTDAPKLPEPCIAIPVDMARLIAHVFLPTNPRKMRKPDPDVLAAVIRFKALAHSAVSIAAHMDAQAGRTAAPVVTDEMVEAGAKLYPMAGAPWNLLDDAGRRRVLVNGDDLATVGTPEDLALAAEILMAMDAQAGRTAAPDDVRMRAADIITQHITITASPVLVAGEQAACMGRCAALALAEAGMLAQTAAPVVTEADVQFIQAALDRAYADGLPSYATDALTAALTKLPGAGGSAT